MPVFATEGMDDALAFVDDVRARTDLNAAGQDAVAGAYIDALVANTTNTKLANGLRNAEGAPPAYYTRIAERNAILSEREAVAADEATEATQQAAIDTAEASW